MREYNVRKTQFTVLDFLSWQREGTLTLTPPFQRRSVWKPDAKSYFIDTVVKGLPAPIIYLRQRVDLLSQLTTREVVDGQQRLRTLFAYVDPTTLPDYDPKRDAFEIKAVHNKDLGGKVFSKLRKRIQHRILSYEFSTHVLPLDVEDREVLEMFARLNATGVKLNRQELRNAEYFREYKTAMYQLAMEQLDRWRQWGIFTDDNIARMKEVETVSDLVLNMIKGLTGKTQKRLDDIYEKYDAAFNGRAVAKQRFRQTMDQIENLLGPHMAKSAYSSEVYFFTLFVFVYDCTYGLGAPLARRAPRKLRPGLRSRLLKIGDRFSSEEVPQSVLDAVQRASSDLGRRKTRLDYIKKECHA